jgi:hypothetical protein
VCRGTLSLLSMVPGSKKWRICWVLSAYFSLGKCCIVSVTAMVVQWSQHITMAGFVHVGMWNLGHLFADLNPKNSDHLKVHVAWLRHSVHIEPHARRLDLCSAQHSTATCEQEAINTSAGWTGVGYWQPSAVASSINMVP